MHKKTALLVIDMQNDFVKEGGTLEVKGIRMGIPKLKRFIGVCRGQGVPIVFTRHCYTPKGNPIQAALFPLLTKRKSLLKGTEGWQIYAELAPEQGDTLIDKTRYDAFFKTNLHEILRKKGIDTVIITGTMTEVCCESTARTAMLLDYKVVFCSDLTFTSSEVLQQRTLEVIKRHFGKIMPAKNMII